MNDPGPFPAEWLSIFTEGELERLAIMTIDGGLDDQEALLASGLIHKIKEGSCK